MQVRSNRYRVLGGREVAPGDVIDSQDFPALDKFKWNQLVEQGFVIPTEDDGQVYGGDVAARQQRELGRARQIVASSPVVDGVAPVSLACDLCDFVAKAPHGLTVHRGKKHKE